MSHTLQDAVGTILERADNTVGHPSHHNALCRVVFPCELTRRALDPLQPILVVIPVLHTPTSTCVIGRPRRDDCDDAVFRVVLERRPETVGLVDVYQTVSVIVGIGRASCAVFHGCTPTSRVVFHDRPIAVDDPSQPAIGIVPVASNTPRRIGFCLDQSLPWLAVIVRVPRPGSTVACII